MSRVEYRDVSFKKDTRDSKIIPTKGGFSHYKSYEFHTIPDATVLLKLIEHPSFALSKIKERWYRQYRLLLKNALFSVSSSFVLGDPKYLYQWKQVMSDTRRKGAWGFRILENGNLIGAAFLNNIQNFKFSTITRPSDTVRKFTEAIKKESKVRNIVQIGSIVATRHSLFPLVNWITEKALQHASLAYIEVNGKCNSAIIQIFTKLGWRYLTSNTSGVTIFYIARSSYLPYFKFGKVSSSFMQAARLPGLPGSCGVPQRVHNIYNGKLKLKPILKRKGKKGKKKHVKWAPKLITVY